MRYRAVIDKSRVKRDAAYRLATAVPIPVKSGPPPDTSRRQKAVTREEIGEGLNKDLT